MSHDFKAVNPYWQITETKSKNWDITQRHSRKQYPENHENFYFGDVTERQLRKQHVTSHHARTLFLAPYPPHVTLLSNFHI